MMKVVWFKAAIIDLKSLKSHISQDNPIAANKVVTKIREAVNLLSQQPGMGRLGRVPNTKELVVSETPYILPYRVSDNIIEILRVLHASRRWPERL